MTKNQGNLKVALLQLCSGQDKAENLKIALNLAQEAFSKGAGFVLLPEVFNFRGETGKRELLNEVAEKVPGNSVSPFIALARKYKAFILLGSIIEKGTKTGFYNSSLVIDPSGRIAAKYRKIHLFDARIGDKIIKEAAIFSAGKKPTTVNIGPFKAGLSICYDLRFPDLYQHYAREQADILTVPSCFTRKTGQAHWEALLRARAIENLAYVLAPAQVGYDSRGIQAHGHSMIVSPWGKVLACGSANKLEIIFGRLDPQEIQKARRALPGIIRLRRQ